MKVSMISTLPPIKGLSPYTLGLLKGLSHECEVDFYGFKKIYPEFLYPGGTKTDEKEPVIPNVSIHTNLTWYNPFSWIKTGFQIKTDVVHAQWWSWFLAPVYYTILKIAKLRGKRIIITIHNVKPHEKSFFKVWLNNSIINLADEYIVHNEDNKKVFSKNFKISKKISVVPLGLDIKPLISKKLARNRLNLPSNKKIILFFGNIRDYKGLDILVNALKGLPPNILLVVAGQCWDKKMVCSLKSDKRIVYSGGFIKKSEVTSYFSAADLIVYPYKYFDASSAAGAEALAYGKPLVVTNAGGLGELVIDKKIIAKAGNSYDLQEKIIYGLKNVERLSKDSKQRAKEFSWNKIAKKTAGVYAE